MQHIEDNSQDTSSPVSDPEVAPRVLTPDPAPDSDVISLLDYLEVIAKRWRMIVKMTVTAFVLSVVIALLLPNIYSSTAMILPPQQDSSMLGMMSAMTGGMASLAGDLLGKGTTADLYVGMLNSNTVKDAIINRFKLIEVYEQDYRLDTYKKLDKNVDISAGKKDGIISVTVEDKDPKRAANMANAFVEELGKLTVRLNITGASQNRGYLENRLVKAKVDLSRAEDALKSFQLKNRALDVPDQAQATIAEIAGLKAQLATQEVQFSAIRSRFTDSAQEVKDLKTSTSNLRSQIAKLEGKGTGSSAIPSVGAVPSLGQEYVRLMREFKIQEAIFELLSKQYEMTKMDEARNVDGIQIIQKATVPDKKAKPKRSLIVLTATFFAGFGSVLFAFMHEAGTQMPEEDRLRLKQVLSNLVSVLKR